MADKTKKLNLARWNFNSEMLLMVFKLHDFLFFVLRPFWQKVKKALHVFPRFCPSQSGKIKEREWLASAQIRGCQITCEIDVSYPTLCSLECENSLMKKVPENQFEPCFLNNFLQVYKSNFPSSFQVVDFFSPPFSFTSSYKVAQSCWQVLNVCKPVFAGHSNSGTWHLGTSVTTEKITSFYTLHFPISKLGIINQLMEL